MCECGSLSPHNLDQISITSEEQLFMRRLLDLKARENQLKYEVMILEEKEREMAQMLAVEQALCRCSPPQNFGDANINGNIYSELNNIQTNLNMCVNEMEGPLAQELALERVKTRQLENYLAPIQETIDNTRKTFMTTMHELKNEFQCKCSEMLGVNSRNADLKRQARELECKCKQLEGELLQEKLKEAEAVIRLSQTVVGDPAKHYCFCPQAGGDQIITSERSPTRESKSPKNSKSSQTHQAELRKPSKSPVSSKSDTKSTRSSKSETTSTRSLKTDNKLPTQTSSSSRNIIKSPRLSKDKPIPTGIGITRELEVEGDLNVDVETEIRLLDTEQHEYQVETNCDSGTIEIVTQGPAGTIETTMIYTDSGNIEVITEITEYDPEDNKYLQRLPPPPTLLALPCHNETCEKKSKISTTASKKLSQCDDNTCNMVSKKQQERRTSNRKYNTKRKSQ